MRSYKLVEPAAGGFGVKGANVGAHRATTTRRALARGQPTQGGHPTSPFECTTRDSGAIVGIRLSLFEQIRVRGSENVVHERIGQPVEGNPLAPILLAGHGFHS